MKRGKKKYKGTADGILMSEIFNVSGFYKEIWASAVLPLCLLDEYAGV